MKHANVFFSMLGMLVALTGPAYAQYTSLSAQSDVTTGNTAIGASSMPDTASGGTAVGFGSLLHNSGNYNTATGSSALTANTTGTSNTAFGYAALFVDQTTSYNTAVGAYALYGYPAITGMANTAVGANSLSGGYAALSGSFNTATGANAIQAISSGDNNTGTGSAALSWNGAGSNNSALGANALFQNTTGSNNTAVGFGSLGGSPAYTVSGPNTPQTGSGNAAVGYNAMFANLTGANNTAFGATALYSNTTGKGNAAQGVNALYSNTTGIRNLGIGSNALYANNGSYNIALGFDAGYNVTTGSNNIEIGAAGAAADNGTIQIGVQGTQTLTVIAGIYGTPVSGSAVYVNSTGQLGVQASSERFKTDIATMPELTAKLAQLRPVTFHYKTDPTGALQYGLIAEEVAKVYPELVIRGRDGRIDGVRYEELAPLLLNEVQQQQRALQEMRQQVSELKQANESLQATMANVLAVAGERVARR